MGKAAAEKAASEKAASEIAAAEEAAAEKAAADKAAAEISAKDLSVDIYIDRSLDIKTTVILRSGATIKDVCNAVAREDPTGATKPEDVRLAAPGSDAPLETTMQLSERLR